MNTKYVVRIYEMYYLDIPVKANNEEDAKEKAEKMYANEDVGDYDQNYLYAMPKEDWKVEEV